MALPEKALLDAIYFTSKGIKKTAVDDLDLSFINKKVFSDFSKKFPKTKILSNLVKSVLQ